MLNERMCVLGSRWFGFGPSHGPKCHFQLVSGGAEMALFDTGVSVEVGRIVADIPTAGLDPYKFRYVLPTHAHADHLRGQNWSGQMAKRASA